MESLSSKISNSALQRKAQSKYNHQMPRQEQTGLDIYRVWVAQFIQQTICLNSKCYYLKRNAALNFKSLVFSWFQRNGFMSQVYLDVCLLSPFWRGCQPLTEPAWAALSPASVLMDSLGHCDTIGLCCLQEKLNFHSLEWKKDLTIFCTIEHPRIE